MNLYKVEVRNKLGGNLGGYLCCGNTKTGAKRALRKQMGRYYRFTRMVTVKLDIPFEQDEIEQEK